MRYTFVLILVSLGFYGCQTIVDPLGTNIGTITKQVSSITEKAGTLLKD